MNLFLIEDKIGYIIIDIRTVELLHMAKNALNVNGLCL